MREEILLASDKITSHKAGTPSVTMPFTRFDKVAVIVGIAMAGWCAAITWQLLTNYFQPESFAAVSLPTESNKAGFVSSKSCRSCHPHEHASWHQSFHRTMTQVADERTVQAPFDHVELSSRGRTYQLERRGPEFWVNLVDPDLEKARFVRGLNMNDVPDTQRVWRPVVMTTGSHHLQGYWIPSQAGLEIYQIPFVYDLVDQRWFPVEDEFLRPPSEKRRFAVWNSSCIQCHAVAGKPRLKQPRDELWSTVAEFGIACESCHGPGEAHVAKHSNPLERYQQHFSKSADTTIVNPARCDHRRSSEICGQCHSAFAPTNDGEWWHEGYRYRAGDHLEESQHHFTFARTQTEKGEAEFFAQSYWPDGSNRVGGREYLAMTESTCFLKGEMSCLSCHSMHQSEPNDQLAFNKLDNHACLPCHQKINEGLTEHTHHAPSSSGSSCYNCHMPHTSYALMKAIRAHRIDSPRITEDTTSTRPNACNLCHLDQTLPWTQRWLHEWYGQPIESLPTESSTTAASLHWLLKGNAVQRAVTAWHFGWEPALQVSGRDWPTVLLTQVLDDPYAVVRAVADRSLRTLLGEKSLDYDFVAPAEQRQKASTTLFDQMSRRFASGKQDAAKPHRSTEQWRSLLLNHDGQLLQDELRTLIRNRDDRDLELPE